MRVAVLIIMMRYALAGLLLVGITASAYAAAEPHISPVASMSPAILTIQITVEGMPYQAQPLYYPTHPPQAVTGTAALDTGGPGNIVLAQVNGTVRNTLDMVGDPLAVILYGDAPPPHSGDWTPSIPVVYASDGNAVAAAFSENATVSISYGRSAYSLEEVSDVAITTIGEHAFAVTVGRDAIQIIDVSNPDRLIAAASLPYGGTDVEAVPGTVYVLAAHQEGIRILDISSPYQPRVIHTIHDGQDGYEILEGASDIETFEAYGRHFAIVTAFDDDGIQIIDITNPASPEPVSSATHEEKGYEALDGVRGVDVVTVQERTYGVVASYHSDAIQIIDLVNPFLPLPVGSFDGDDDPSVTMDGATDIVVITDDDETYALVTAYNDDAIQIVNITTPAAPTKIRSLSDDVGRFVALSGATDIDVVRVGSTTYGLVSGYNDDAIQIIDLNNPSLPRAVGSTLDDDDLDFYLDGVRGMDTVVIDDTTYLVAAASASDGIQVIDLDRPPSPVPADDVSRPKDITAAWKGSWGMATFNQNNRTYGLVAAYQEDAVQIMDVTNPRLPVPVYTIFDQTGDFESLGGATDVEVAVISGRTYGIVAAYDDDAVQIIDVTDPANPEFVSEMVDGEDGFESLGGPVDIEISTISGRTYGMVAAYDDDAVQIIDLINPRFPIPAADVQRGETFVADDDPGEEDAVEIKIMDGPQGLAVFDIFGRSYCLVASQNDDTVLILEVTNPSQPWPTTILYDDLRGFNAMNGAADIEIIKTIGRTYALVAGQWDGGIQVMDVTDPANPLPVYEIRDNRKGVSAINGAADIELVTVYNRMIAVISGTFDDGLQLMDVTDPANPTPLQAVFDGSAGYDSLDGADDVEIFVAAGSIHVMVAGVDDGAIQIAALTP